MMTWQRGFDERIQVYQHFDHVNEGDSESASYFFNIFYFAFYILFS